MKTGLESLDTGASNITYSGNEGPKSPQQIAEADFMLLEEYQKYVFEMEEMGLEPMSLEEFRQEAMSGMAMGGRAGYASGQLVKPGPGRPGYRGRGSKETKDNRQSYSAAQASANVGRASTSSRSSKSKPKTVSAPVGGGADMATVSTPTRKSNPDLVAAADKAQRET